MKTRCFWATQDNLLMRTYHDTEWGRPVHSDRMHFEMLTLEGAQAGLSWNTILKKRIDYRRVFANFDPTKVVRFSDSKIETLMQDPSIVRNRRKILSTVSNAKAFLTIQKEFGSFDTYIWQFVDGKPIYTGFTGIDNYPTTTEISDTISKDLKKRGFSFVGSTIIYAYMEACGLTQNHTTNCYLHGKRFRTRKDEYAL